MNEEEIEKIDRLAAKIGEVDQLLSYLIKRVEKLEKPEKSKRFVKPSIAEIKEYCVSRSNGIDAENFYNFYESKGWKIGNSPMKSWKAAVGTWEKRSPSQGLEREYYK